MTIPQEKFYWRLWSQLKKARSLKNEDRHGVRGELGLPESHTGWNNAHFDRFKRHCLAQAQPGNYKAQIALVKMDATRSLATIHHYLKALEKPASYAEGIVSRMNRGQALGGKFSTLETLDFEALGKVIIALKMDAKRRWKTKGMLLNEIESVCQASDFDESDARDAVAGALNVPELVVPPAKMDYERLLIVLSALRTLAAARNAVPAADPELSPF